MAFVCWYFLTPDLATMSVLQPGWIGLIWLRNATLLCLFASTLYWWLYIRRAHGREYKLHKQWLATDSKKFLWRNQVSDNMFWSLVSGVTIWSLFESVTHWVYASVKLAIPDPGYQPVYFTAMVWIVFFWNTIHFYCIHRLLHWQPMCKYFHELHHRNIYIGPWSGLSMHPVEHVLYFPSLALWWLVPVHPVIILLTALVLGLAPTITHAGFEQLVLNGSRRVYLSDWFHQLHHQYFTVNYGNVITPLDKVFGSWHNGTSGTLAP